MRTENGVQHDDTRGRHTPHARPTPPRGSLPDADPCLRRGAAMRHVRTTRMTPLLRDQQSPSSSSSSEGSPEHKDEVNPFAPPPEGRPDQPWQPRPQPGGGSGRDGGESDDRDTDGDSRDENPPQPPAWGSQWSSRQPGRQGGDFGAGTGPDRPAGPTGQGRRTGGPRWDPTDPAQRRARYALLSGIWAFFFALFSLPQIALLLGALALYWSISALRAKPEPTAAPAAAGVPDAPPPAPGATRVPLPAPGTYRPKPQATAAVVGLVAGAVALVIVAATFALQIVYSDYYTCVDDALTQTSRHSCETQLPEQLRPLLSTGD